MLYRFAGSFSVKTKLWAGYLLLLSLLALVSGLTLVSLNQVRSQVDEMVAARQPTVMLSKTLTGQLQRAVGSLGFYLLSKESTHLTAYNESLQRVDEIIVSLQTIPIVANDSHAAGLVGKIHDDVGRLRALEPDLLAAASDYEKNFPGIAFANTQINPITRTMVQLASQMLASEMEEETTEHRRQLLVYIAELRYVWSNVMNGIRGFLAFRSPGTIADMALYIERAVELMGAIEAFGDDLTLDQADSLEQFQQSFDQFKVNHQKMLQIHGGDQWRTDSWLVRSEIGPLVDQIENSLSGLVAAQERGIGHTSDKLIADTANTIRLVFGLLGLGLVVGIAIAWGVAQMISKLLWRLLQQGSRGMPSTWAYT